MATDDSGQITALLSEYCEGDEVAFDQLLPLIYDTLHRMARQQRRRQRGHATLNTTALVHEAYLKLSQHTNASWSDRTHFYRVAARAMRQILVDYARKQQAAKRGGKQPDASFNEKLYIVEEKAHEMIALNDALDELAELDARQSKVVELRYFVGFTIPETAEALGISVATVKRDWTAARAWLHLKIANAYS